MTTPAAPAPAPAAPVAPTPAPGVTKPTTAKPADAKVAQGEPSKAEADKIRVRGYERAQRVKAKLEETEGPADAGEEAEAKPEPKSTPSEERPKPESAKEPITEPDARAKARDERQKRLEEFARKEREREAERAQKRQGRQAEQEVEKLRKRIAELEPMNEVFASEEALLAAAESRGMSAEKLVQWMRTRLSDPSAVAQRQAKTEADRIRDEVRKENESMRQELEQLRQEREQERERREAFERATTFEKMVTARTETHPLTARLLQRRGVDGLVRFANEQIIPYLPNDDLGYLHDVTEQYLEWLTGDEAPSPEAAASGASPLPKKNGAEKPVTTLSNSLAAERISVTEEIPLHRLPLEERTRRLKAKLGND